MVLNPIGTLMMQTDAALQSAMTVGVTAMVTWVPQPAILLAVSHYAIQGFKLANGDQAPLENFMPRLFRVGIIIWLVSNLDVFNEWIVGLFYNGIPDALNRVLADAMGASAIPAGSGVTGAAAVFNQLWNLIGVVVGNVWEHAGFLDFSARFAGFVAMASAETALLVMALIYILSRFVMGVLIIMAPVIIALALLDVTKPIAERATGKAISLIVMQVSVMVILQITLTGDQWFLNQIIAASADPSATGGMVLASELQNLCGMVVWMFASVIALLSISAISYSIGTGVALSAGSIMSAVWAASMASALIGRAIPALGRIPPYPGAGSYPNVNIGMPTRQLGAAKPQMALPPPPPSPII